MKINLYYVEGISRIDTPSFNTKTHIGTIQDQEEFFLTKLVKSIDSTFYPPHYQNSIKFDKDDLEITDNVNYLSLEYNGKIYYYFIDKIDYTSTGIITLSVSMDTVQTFMFNIFISNGIIERKFINRWRDTNRINRNYIRENVSNGLFTYQIDKQILNEESKYWLVVGIFTKQDKSNTLENLVPGCLVQNLDNNIDDENIIMTAPYAIKIATLQPFTITDVQSQDYLLTSIHFAKSAAYIAETRDLFICPFNCMPHSLSFNLSQLKLQATNYRYNTWFISKFNFDAMHGEDVYYICSQGNMYTTETLNQEVNFGFIRNTNINEFFRANFVPALLDENYIRLTFGSNNTDTTFPLYQLNYDSVYCRYAFNLINGHRIYYISPDVTSNKDLYNTMVIDTNVLSIDLKNDAWAQYIASNKNRWSMLINSATTGAISTMVKTNEKGGYSISDMNSKTGSSLVNSAGSLINQIYTEGNLKHTPPSVKQTGNFSTSALGKSALIYYKTELVNDYYQCAEYYHRNGYLINEHVNYITDIFNYVTSRYYYDLVKMRIAEVHLHNVIEDETTINKIKERFEIGLRLWHIKNSSDIGNFSFDNVENDYIS